jgi:hypothetical protein
MRHILTALLATSLAACSGGGDDGTATTEGVASIDGSTYEVNIGGLTTPNADPDLASVIKLFFSAPVLLHVHGQTEGGMNVRMAFGDGAAQDPCAPTSDFPAATFTGSDFDFGPSTTTFYTTTTSFEVLDLAGMGTVSSGGSSLDDLELSGRVDLRQAIGFAGFDDVDNLCSTFSELGLTCADCGDGSATCVDLELAGMSAASVDIDVQPISASEAAAACPATN